MKYIDHDHHYSLPRGGKVITGDDNFNGENTVIDTPEYDSRRMPTSFKSTGKIGVIQPCLSMHVNTGDRLKFDANLFQRFQPIVATPLTSIESSIHAFYVPYRMIDYGFENFFTGGPDGNYKRPLLNINFGATLQQAFDPDGNYYPMFGNGVMSDSWVYPTYFGKPLGGVGSLLEDFKYGYKVTEWTDVNTPKISGALDSAVNVELLLAYQRIYNDYYRVPEIETDLFIHNENANLHTYYTSLMDYTFTQEMTVEGESTTCTFLKIREVLEEWQFTENAEGFLGYMLHVLTDPILNELRQSFALSESATYFQGVVNDADGSRFYDRSTNAIDLSTVTTIVSPASQGTEASTILAVDMSDLGSMSEFDVCLFVFSVLLCTCKNAPYERDRFTSVLPYLQRGEFVKMVNNVKLSNPNNVILNNHALTIVGNNEVSFENGDLFDDNISVLGGRTASNLSYSNLHTNITMDQIRTLNACTKFLEKNARLGYRFDEYVNGMFGIDVKESDHLAKPTYFGGLKGYSNIDIVTSPTAVGDSLAAQQAANMTLGENGFIGSVNIPEPGIIVALLNCKPRTQYINSVDRNNFKFADRTLLYNPDFAHLQEQPVWISEVSAALNDSQDIQTQLGNLINGYIEDYDATEIAHSFFGYEPRYSEYKNVPDFVGGELATSQIYNTTARQIVSDTDDTSVVNDYFFQHVLYNDPSVLRIFNFNDDIVDQFQFAVGWQIECKSLVPNNSNPRL